MTVLPLLGYLHSFMWHTNIEKTEEGGELKRKPFLICLNEKRQVVGVRLQVELLEKKGHLALSFYTAATIKKTEPFPASYLPEHIFTYLETATDWWWLVSPICLQTIFTCTQQSDLNRLFSA